jgi:hypothetical protein
MFTGRDNSAPFAAETTDMLATKKSAAKVYFFIMLEFKIYLGGIISVC